VHEQAIHLLVVSEDLSEFYHLHPEQEADGRFRLVYTFPQAGHYRLYRSGVKPMRLVPWDVSPVDDELMACNDVQRSSTGDCHRRGRDTLSHRRREDGKLVQSFCLPETWHLQINPWSVLSAKKAVCP
jgi:hypothetical protein